MIFNIVLKLFCFHSKDERKSDFTENKSSKIHIEVKICLFTWQILTHNILTSFFSRQR